MRFPWIHFPVISPSCPLHFPSCPIMSSSLPLHVLLMFPSCPCPLPLPSASFPIHVPFIYSHFPTSPFVSVHFPLAVFCVPSVPCIPPSYVGPFPFISPSFRVFRFLSPACPCILLHFTVISPSFPLESPSFARHPLQPLDFHTPLHFLALFCSSAHVPCIHPSCGCQAPPCAS